MAETDPKSLRAERLAKIILILIFLGGLGLFFWWVQTAGPGFARLQLSWFDLVLLGLATFRLGRMIAFDRVAEPLRSPFTRTTLDYSGAGNTVVPRGEGVQQALGQLISCPICVGTWVAAVLVVLYYLWPEPTRLFLVILAAVGLAELLHSVTEVWCWTGIHARTKTGQLLQQRREGRREKVKLAPKE